VQQPIPPRSLGSDVTPLLLNSGFAFDSLDRSPRGRRVEEAAVRRKDRDLSRSRSCDLRDALILQHSRARARSGTRRGELRRVRASEHEPKTFLRPSSLSSCQHWASLKSAAPLEARFGQGHLTGSPDTDIYFQIKHRHGDMINRMKQGYRNLIDQQ